MTLATMRSYVWKSNGDVVLHYRLKGNVEAGTRPEAAPSRASSTTVVEEGDKSSISTTTTTLAGDGIASV